MKGIVAYDTVHGNTKQVAEAIAEQISFEGHEIDVVSVKEGGGGKIAGNFLFIGSPTRIGRMTGSAKDFVESLDVGQWKNKPIATFDTVGPLSKDKEKREKWLKTIEEGSKNAGSRMHELLRKRGLSPYSRVLHVPVTGMTGPLAPGGLATARDFTHEFLTKLK